MATQFLPVITGPEGTTSLVFDDVANTWTGIRLQLTRRCRVYGFVNGAAFTATQTPGTRTLTFTPAIVLTLQRNNMKNIDVLVPLLRCEFGVGSE